MSLSLQAGAIHFQSQSFDATNIPEGRSVGFG
jgi:hypothetical protein